MASETQSVRVIGAGLAGCEAAFALANLGLHVDLVEMKPQRRTAAQKTDFFAELVCSNSLRSRNPQNAVGLLKQEMAQLGSLVLRAATDHQVPAGDALAVERIGFGQAIEQALRAHPRIRHICGAAESLPDEAAGACLVATGPLTDPPLAEAIARRCGRDRLYFYDALAPIVSGDSIDREVVFAQSRWDKGDGADYLNCPMDAAQYDAFYTALVAAESMPLHAFESAKYFSGCMPLEVVAQGGRESLRFGAMKPVGLRDPRTGQRPHAVVQLRQEDHHGQAYNLVGFQTKLTHPEQRRILRMIPGLEAAQFLRLGTVHRNTYLDSPDLLDERMRLSVQPNLRFIGQITGVEGYVESAAHGLIVAHLLAADLAGRPLALPPPTTALGALLGHVSGSSRLPGRPHEPANINWSMFPPPPAEVRKADRKAFRVGRAQADLLQWAQQNQLALRPLEHAAPHAA
jgi:methylenetetrahydrofolate--tRNA-(uracil-5-)-methyltransferase